MKIKMFILILGLFLFGCGSSNSSTVISDDSDILLESKVFHVASGEQVTLGSQIDENKPILFWFWSPH